MSNSLLSLQGINEMILSLKFDNCKAEIISADAQASYKGGVSVLVTGVLTGEDGAQRMFTQFFFLAPQDTGYYVLNDMFRYVEEKSAAPVSLPTSGDIAESPEAPATPEPGILSVPFEQVFHCLLLPGHSYHDAQLGFAEVSEKPVVENVSVKEVPSNGKEDTLCAENGKAPVSVKETTVESPADSSINDDAAAAAATPSVVQGDGSKKSFASIVSSGCQVSTKFHELTSSF